MTTTNVKVELFYGGAWNTVPVYTRDPVVVTMGRSGESTDTPPSSASFTISNLSLNYNPAYGGSVLFGKAGRYTPVRITIGSEVYVLEAAKWVPGREIPNVSGTRGDAWVKVTAAGIRRRLGQGRKPMKSSHYQHLKGISVAYWPLDEGANTFLWTDIIGGLVISPSTFTTGQITSGQQQIAPWLENGLHLDQSVLITTPQIIPSIAPDVNGKFAMTWVTRRNDTQQSWEVLFANADGSGTVGSVTVFGNLNEVDVNVMGTTTAQTHPEANVDGPICWQLLMGNSGSNVVWSLYQVGNANAMMSGTTTGQQVQNIGFVQITGGVNISHLAISQSWPAISTDYGGFQGEDPGTRFGRLCAIEGITQTTKTASVASVPMGRQYPGTILDQFDEIERTNNALIVDTQGARGVTYYPGTFFYNRSAALTIDFNLYQLSPPTVPVLDDQYVRNDITIQRRDGARIEAIQTTGPNNTQDPTADPQGIGTVSDQITVNNEFDSDLTNIAQWLLHVKTFDGVRCPSVTVDYVANPGLAIAAIGDRISIINLPPDMGQSTLDLLVVGRTDTATPGTRVMTYTTVPYDPYRVYQVENGADENSRIPPADGETTTTGTLTTTATSVGISSTTVQWIDSTNYASQFPFDIMVDGERMTVTAISGTGLTQTMTVTRSVNGVVKSHSSGVAIQLYQPAAVAL